MPDQLRERIAANLSTLPDEELLTIWVTNDRASWSDTAFEVVLDVLIERGLELPEQRAPAANEPDEEKEEPGLREDEGSQEEPIFYRPDEVFSLARTVRWLAPAAVVITVIAGWSSLVSLYRGGESLLTTDPAIGLLGLVIGLLGTGLFVILQCALIYFGLRAVSAVLRILMEMEFNSRGQPLQESEG